MVGILAYIYKDQVRLELELNLNNTFLTNYDFDLDKTDAINRMQQKVRNILYFILFLLINKFLVEMLWSSSF